MRRLDGRVAIITGSTSGIGLTTARAMADEGAAVTISGIDAERADTAPARSSRVAARRLECWPT